jgi:aminoglycoside phosphotransferase (APT) family kinase protein
MDETVGRLLAVGNSAEIFEWGSRVVKLYKSAAAKPAAFREAAIHATVEALGLPVPAVWGVKEIEGRWGLVFDRVSQPTFAEPMLRNPDDIPRYLDSMVRLQMRIHALAAVHFAGLKVTLAARIAATRLPDARRKQALLDGIADMPDGDRLCHGDFHPLNILGEPSQPVIIDWLDARRGDPAADVCRSYLLLKLHAGAIAVPYLDMYCQASGLAPQNVLGWLPFVAAAKLAEEVPGERDALLEIVG